MNVQPLHLPPGVSWIDRPEALAEAVPDLLAASELAIDTEADSYYAYRVKVCLLQVSTRVRDYLIDPLAGLDLAPLARACADGRVLKVMHAAANDVALLRRHAGFEFENIFDTMVAAQVLGLKRPGLAALLSERFGVEQKKSFQTSDWAHRPLTEGQLSYAAADTRWLLPLKDQLAGELERKGRFEEAREEFERLRALEMTERELDPDAFRRAPGAHRLDPVGLRILRDLFVLRDDIAARRDRSPHRVLTDRALVELALARPASARDLFSVDGIPRWQLERESRRILESIERSVAKGPLALPRAPRREPAAEGALDEVGRRVFEALRDWRRWRAEERGVDESRVATTATLRHLAREAPLTLERIGEIPGMSPFRVREYGEEIVRVVAKTRGG